ncbi:MAG: hypothetical protein RMK00_09250 [Bacteroidota bacterium]|nr:hypothetical protein [Bacteroidota bacterium]
MKVIVLEPLSSWTAPLRSDTLWGLLLVAIRHVHGEQKAQEVAHAARRGEPLFVVSSAMPFVRRSGAQAGRTYLLPAPLLPTQQSPGDTLAEAEEYHRKQTASFLPLRLWCQKAGVNVQFQHASESEGVAVDLDRHFVQVETVHVSLDRMCLKALERPTADGDMRGQLYTCTETFAANAGLWFIVEGEMELLQPALRFLEHVGFGTDATVGKGHFRVEESGEIAFFAKNPTHVVTLSLYVPGDEELQLLAKNPSNMWYELEFRQGRQSPHFGPVRGYQKQPIACYREGSVFPLGERYKPVWGKASVVGKGSDHDVLHAGFGLMVPIQFQE